MLRVRCIPTKGAGGTWRAQVRVATDQAGQAPKLVVDLDAKQLAGKPALEAVWGQVQALAEDVQKDLAAKNLSKAVGPTPAWKRRSWWPWRTCCGSRAARP